MVGRDLQFLFLYQLFISVLQLSSGSKRKISLLKALLIQNVLGNLPASLIYNSIHNYLSRASIWKRKSEGFYFKFSLDLINPLKNYPTKT
jgi:hypothetical protein